MTLPIQLELTDGQIRASVNGTTNLSVTAPTLNEAVSRLQIAVVATNGTTAPMEGQYPPATISYEDPHARFAADLKDNPLFDDWIEAMQEWRRDREADPNW